MLSFEHYVSLRRLYLIFLMYSCRILSFHYKCSLFDLRMPEILVYVGIDFFFRLTICMVDYWVVWIVHCIWEFRTPVHKINKKSEWGNWERNSWLSTGHVSFIVLEF